MQSELDKTEKDLFLSILQKSSYYKQLLGFNIFEEQRIEVLIFHISEWFLSLIERTKQNKKPWIIPILASSEEEKTQYYKLLKKKLMDFHVVNIPSSLPQKGVDVNFYSHVYMSIIEVLGSDILDETAINLIKRYSEDRKLKLNDLIKKGIENFPGKPLKCIKALLYYQLSMEKQGLAKRWLILDNLTKDEMEELNIKYIGEEDKSLELIKIISEFSENPLILYFDDIEILFENFDEESDAIRKKIFETLQVLFDDKNNFVLIMVCLRKFWEKILKMVDKTFQSLLKREQSFHFFEGLIKFIQIAMEIFWTQNDIEPPEDPIFPLSEELIKKLFKKSRGSISEFLTLCVNSIEDIASRGVSLEELLH